MKKIKKWEIILYFGLFLLISIGLTASIKIGQKKYFPREESEGDVKILFMGDSNFAYEFESYSIPDMIGATEGYSIYNIAIGGSGAAEYHTFADPDRREDLFGFHYLTRIAVTGNYQSVVTMENENTADEIDRIIYLTQIDLREIDYIVISYGLNDYMSGIPIEGEDPYDESTYCGALRSGIRRLRQETDAKIILTSVTYAFFEDEVTGPADGYEIDYGGGTIDAYRDAAQMVALEFQDVIFYDALEELGINETNYRDYMLDTIHLNEKARTLYAEKLLKVIEEN